MPDFDINNIPYEQRYMTDDDGVRWIMLEEAKREIEKAKAESPWTNVEDGLPKEENTYLTESNLGNFKTKIFDPAFSEDKKEWEDQIKRWMRIPE